MEKKNNKKGFTLVELVIVVAVMAILVAIAIPTVSSITDKARSSVDDSNARTIESMIKLEQADLDKDTLSDGEIKSALEDAKLGITEGSYVFDPTTGTCASGTSAGSGQFLISFSSTEITVTAGSGTPVDPTEATS